MRSIRQVFTVIPIILIFSLVLVLLPSNAQDAVDETTGDTYLLRFDPEPGAEYTYSLTTSGTRGDRIAVRTEYYTVSIADLTDGKFGLIAEGEDVADGAPLAYRFQRAYFPQFPYTIDELGATDIAFGQPFPPFVNIPILPEEEISVGSTWSGGPSGILPDRNVGTITFTFQSTVKSIASYRGENCAVIETSYEVALEGGRQSFRSFLGLVEGDPPEEPGQGAPVGGIVDGSRAEEVGIQPGDMVIEAEGERIRGWGGLEEIIPLIIPEKPLELRIKRGDEEFDVEIIPEGIPVALVSAAGGLISTCFFSTDRGIPLKVDVQSEELVFTLTYANEETEEREVELHIIWEYQYAGR